MNYYSCENCLQEFGLTSFNKNLHYFYCQKCINKIDIISKSKSKSAFILTDKDLNNLKYIYTGKDNNYKHYLSKDIEALVLNKYGNLANMNALKKNNIDKKDEQKNNLKLKRENEIKEIFNLNKLEFKNYGDCYSYINYGKPDIETIIKNEINKTNEKNKRRIKLSNELSKLDIPFDETLKPCYEYVNNIGTREFNDVIRATEVEYFLRTRTQYGELCKKFDNETAKEIAMRNYSGKHLLKYSEIKVCFD